MRKVALYMRVSTFGQSIEMQRADLRRYCDARGWTIHKEYVDQGISGTKEKRPGLDAMMDDARHAAFEIVLCWSFDRFARTTEHLIAALQEFKELGKDFISFRESIDTSTALGKALFTIVAAIAELERNLTINA
jgi:DNA invertase Pin-like site-specific DNA recombinase